MRQFYRVEARASEVSVIFDKPVRRMCIESNEDVFMYFRFSATERSSEFAIFARTPMCLDFQSANHGGGVPNIVLRAVDQAKSPQVFITISEYGTGGDINWYK